MTALLFLGLGVTTVSFMALGSFSSLFMQGVRLCYAQPQPARQGIPANAAKLSGVVVNDFVAGRTMIIHIVSGAGSGERWVTAPTESGIASKG